MKGGLIGEIPERKLLSFKSPKAYTIKAKEVLNLLAFKNIDNIIESKISVQGSFTFPLYPYYSDIDSINRVFINTNYDKGALIFFLHLQKLALKLKNNKDDIQFSDLKCGLDNNNKGIHWKLEEIIFGHKNNYSLYEALKQDGYCKIDVITPYYDRYIEISMIYNVKCLDGNIGQTPFTLEEFKKQIKKSYEELLQEGNIYKAIKRLYSLSRLNNDTKTIKKIEPLLTSNLGKLSTIKSDLATINLMINNKNNISLEYLNLEFSKIKEAISTILDIPINYDKFYDSIDEIYILFKQSNYKDAENKINILIDSIYNQLNNETIKYIKYNKIKNIL